MGRKIYNCNSTKENEHLLSPLIWPSFFIGPRSDHSLRMSVTHSLTEELVEDWMNWPEYADYADHADYAKYADSAEYAEYAEYA